MTYTSAVMLLISSASLTSCGLFPPRGSDRSAISDAHRGTLRRSGFSQEAKSVTLPLKYTMAGMLVEVRINGKPVKLLLDTGASMTFLSPDLAQRLGLVTQGPGLSVKTVDGGRVEGRRAMTRRISIGEAWTENEPVTVAPILPGIDGVLGVSTLADWDVRIDPSARKLTLFAAGKAPHLKGETTLPLTCRLTDPSASRVNPQGLRSIGLTVPVRVNNREIMATPDTGYGGDFALSERLMKTYAPKSLKSEGSRQFNGRGVSGKITGREVKLEELVFGSDSLRQISVDVDDVASGSRRERNGLIGLDLLEHYVMTFRFADRELGLKPLGTVQNLTRRSSAGFSVDHDGQVLNVARGGPAATAGLLAGDRLLEIEGRPLNHVTSEEMSAIRLRPAGSMLKIRYRRGNARPVEVKLVLVKK